jgi:hypothetical protein
MSYVPEEPLKPAQPAEPSVPTAPTVEPQAASLVPEPSSAPTEVGFSQILNQVQTKDLMEQPGVMVTPTVEATPPPPLTETPAPTPTEPLAEKLSPAEALEKYGYDPRPKPKLEMFPPPTYNSTPEPAPVPMSESPIPTTEAIPPVPKVFVVHQPMEQPSIMIEEPSAPAQSPTPENVHPYGVGDEPYFDAHTVESPQPTQPSTEPIAPNPFPPVEPTTLTPPNAPIEQQAQSLVEPAPAPSVESTILTPANLTAPYVGTGAEFSGDATTAYIPQAGTEPDENNLLARKPAQPQTETTAPEKSLWDRIRGK